jgi:Asp-tRNA(Asn)/Glu-tRNA(Gln) amidotransferase A subunit family amidase
MASGALRPDDVVRTFLGRIEDADRRLHAFLTVPIHEALKQAANAFRIREAGERLGPLFGVPVAIKDLYWTTGIRTTGGSLVYRNHVPTSDSIYAERLKAAGAVIVGKTNTPEFGLSFRTRNALAPETVNPWDPSRTCGGSSGGTAAAVAGGLCPAGLGGDSAGSTRIPAALCGLFGLQPTHGRVPNLGGFGGVLPLFSSAGPMTRDVRDAATILQIIAPPDDRDSVATRAAAPDYLADLDKGIDGLRVAWMPTFGHDNSAGSHGTPDVLRAVQAATLKLEEAGARVVEESLALDLDRLWVAFVTIADADRYAAFGALLYEDAATRAQLAPATLERFECGRSVPAVAYSLALSSRLDCIRRLDRFFENYDVIASPTVGRVAPTFAELSAGDVAPQDMFAYVAHTFIANFAGNPAVTIPAGDVGGVPVGLHLMARPHEDALLLQAARVFEQIQPWAGRYPAS